MSENKQYQYDVIVLGCGPAGQRAAVQAAKLKKKVAIIDKREVVGGNCVNSGTIPSKSFKEAVVFLSGYRQRYIYGAGYTVKSEIEMSDLTFRCDYIMRTEIEIIENQLKRNHIEVLHGQAKFLDAHTIELSHFEGASEHLTSETFIIATGAHPRRPDGISFNGRSIFDSDDVLKMAHVPRDMTVVGGGVIGIEYSSMFAALGVHVTVVETQKRLLPFVDQEIIECLQYQMRAMGITIRLGEEVENCEERSDGRVVTSLKSGKVIVSDSVLFSAGRVAATDNLGLEMIGIVPGPRGKLLVNEHFQTSLPNIYGAGDVIGFPGLASASSEQGRVATLHAFNVKTVNPDKLLPYGIYSIPEISMIGPTEEELTEKGIPYEVGVARYKEIARGQLIGDPNGMLKLLFERGTNRLLAVHIIGEHATELVHLGQAIIAFKGGLDYLLNTVFNYPTLGECYKVAALDAYNKMRA